MRRPAVYAWILSAHLALTPLGCGSTETNELGVADLLVRIEKPVYSKSADDAVRSALINQGSERIYALLGEYVYIEQWSDGGWLYQGPWFVIDGIGTSIPVSPGDSLVPLPMSLEYVSQAGVYRFVFQVSLDSLGRQPFPEAARVSEPFEVTW
jgi:hypothetical protein